MFTMLGCGTAVATIATPEPGSSMKVTDPIVTPTNQPAYLWIYSIKSQMVWLAKQVTVIVPKPDKKALANY